MYDTEFLKLFIIKILKENNKKKESDGEYKK